jgi:hypothetical protein
VHVCKLVCLAGDVASFAVILGSRLRDVLPTEALTCKTLPGFTAGCASPRTLTLSWLLGCACVQVHDVVNRHAAQPYSRRNRSIFSLFFIEQTVSGMQVLESNDMDEMEQNVARIAVWARQFRAARGGNS